MKYQAHQEIAGTWFVNTFKKNGEQFGKRFDTEQEAKEYALLQSHNYYQMQMDQTWKKLKTLSGGDDINGEIQLIGYDNRFSQGDLMC